MRIFIAGGTGVLGRRLIRTFTERGHDVVAIARDDDAAELVRSLGGTPATADLFDAPSLARAAAGAEVIVHAATAIPAGPAGRSRSAWELNDRIRRDGTRALTEAAAQVGARRYLQQSVVWVVRSPAASPYDEHTTPSPPALLESAVDGERIARGAGARHGFSVGILRGGMFYGADAGTRDMVAMLERRRLPIIGRGDWLVAPVHADDMARAFALAAESDMDGTWHVVDDEPLPFARLLHELAATAGTPPPRRVPRALARVLLGPHVLESLTTSMNTSNARVRRDLGWAPLHPTFRDGLPGALE